MVRALPKIRISRGNYLRKTLGIEKNANAATMHADGLEPSLDHLDPHGLTIPLTPVIFSTIIKHN